MNATLPITLNSIWQKIGYTSLDSDSPKHLWRPSIDKWKEYLSAWLIEIYLESNLRALEKELGYDGMVTIDELPTSLKTDHISSEYFFDDFIYFGGLGKEMVSPPPENMFWRDKSHGVMAVFNDEKLFTPSRVVLEAPLFRHIHSACFWEQEPTTLLN